MDGLKQEWILNGQHSTVDDLVKADIRKLWRFYELNNDQYWNFDMTDPESKEDYPNLWNVLNEALPEDESEVLINWWW